MLLQYWIFEHTNLETNAKQEYHSFEILSNFLCMTSWGLALEKACFRIFHQYLFFKPWWGSFGKQTMSNIWTTGHSLWSKIKQEIFSFSTCYEKNWAKENRKHVEFWQNHLLAVFLQSNENHERCERLIIFCF